MNILNIEPFKLEHSPWIQMQSLINECYTAPPCDVFQRVLSSTYAQQRLWLATHNNTVQGMIMLAPHSKGGHLETLAVSPKVRRQGIAKKLVRRLFEDTSSHGPCIISLTTRIPDFFANLGFIPNGQLVDGTTAMTIFL